MRYSIQAYAVARKNKKAQLTQGLRATVPSFQYGRQLPSGILAYRTENSAIPSADSKTSSL